MEAGGPRIGNPLANYSTPISLPPHPPTESYENRLTLDQHESSVHLTSLPADKLLLLPNIHRKKQQNRDLELPIQALNNRLKSTFASILNLIFKRVQYIPGEYGMLVLTMASENISSPLVTGVRGLGRSPVSDPGFGFSCARKVTGLKISLSTQQHKNNDHDRYHGFIFSACL